jgi:ketosteroid isomerase-like protein
MIKRIFLTTILALGNTVMAIESEERTIWIEEIWAVETTFAAMAAESGLKEAFLYFADEVAVINRGGRIYRGKEEIADYFNTQQITDVSLTWAPEYVDVSADGTMAYTYGPFTFKGTPPDKKPVEISGIFHTVWKRQKDGSWKYVYD